MLKRVRESAKETTHKIAQKYRDKMYEVEAQKVQ